MKLLTSLIKTIFQCKSEVKKLQLVTVYHIFATPSADNPVAAWQHVPFVM